MGIRRNWAPVTEPSTDPALFRLRAFEVDWLTPLLKAPSGELNAVLAAEAQRWILLGQEVGYFADAPSYLRLDQSLPKAAAGFFQGALPAVDFADFRYALNEAQDDLTPERREFLDLVLFADDAVWHARLHEVWKLAGELTGRPALRLSDEAMDSVSWSLAGAESQMADGAPYLPAHWRSSDNTFIQAMWPVAEERLARLKDARDAIAAAAESLAADETPTIKLPIAIVARRVNDRSAAEVVLVSVTAVSLGIATRGGVMTKVVERDTMLPTSRTERFSTAEDSQTSVEIVVLQGESELAADNRELFRFTLGDIRPARRGIPQIEVTFEIDVSGTIKMSARAEQTRTGHNITVTETVTVTETADLEDSEINQTIPEEDESSGESYGQSATADE
jgi:Hsp70 protein